MIALFACHLPALGQRYSFQHFDSRDGLRNQDVNCLFQDHVGRLWVCTEYGLYRFNGSRFDLVPTVEGLSSPWIQSVAEDSTGRIWASTPNKLNYRDETGLHDVAPQIRDLKIDLRTSIAISQQDPSRVYFVSEHTLKEAYGLRSGQSWQIINTFSDADVSRLPVLANISNVYASKSGELWFGCGKAICESVEGTVKVWGTGEGVPEDDWTSLLQDSSGNFWARGEHSVARLASGAPRFVAEMQGLSPSVLEVRSTCLIEDPAGGILINTVYGFSRWNNHVWSVITKQNGLPAGSTQSMLFDRQGSLWFDAGTTGLHRWIGYGNWEGWTVHEHLDSDLVWSVFRDSSKRLWLGTELGLEELKAEGGTLVPEEAQGKPHVRRVQSIAETADKHFWLGSDDGSIVEYEPRTGVSKFIANEGNIYQILVDRTDRVWILGVNGLFLVHRDSLQIGRDRILEAKGPKARFFRAVQDSSGTILLSSDAGIFRLDGDRLRPVEMPADYRTTYNAQLALGADHTFWLVGSSPSLLRFRLVDAIAKTVDEVRVPQIASANVYQLDSDRNHWLWVGTDSGMDVYNGSQWRHVSQEDGLVWDDTNTGAFSQDGDGSIWIGTSGGLAHVLHPERLFASSPLEIRLNKVELGDKTLRQGVSPVFAWGHYALSFHVSTSDFSRMHAIRFRYRLSGVDDGWQETANQEIRYPFVPDGKHRLEVMAVDAGTNRTSDLHSIDFKIRPPWWRTPEFFFGLACGLVLIVMGAWRWNNRLAIARQRILENLVRERTKELERKNSSLMEARSALMELATHDSLTGILNRGAIYSLLETEIDRMQREARSLILVMADIDHFKKINDVYGHQCGDSVLQQIAWRLRSTIRTYDSLGRYGGEEFVLIIPGLSEEEAPYHLERLRKAVESEPVRYKDVAVNVTCSFGATLYREGYGDIQDLIRIADLALYDAKAKGRNRFEFVTHKDSSQPSPVRSQL